MNESIRLGARFQSGDIHAEVGMDGVTLTLHGDEQQAYADFDWETVLRLGEWLVERGRARGNASRTIDAQGTGF